MRVYHGTIAEFAKEIKKTGLLPMDKNKFALEFGDPLAEEFGFTPDIHNTYHDEPTQVHVTDDIEHAKEYAAFRARYENAKPGSKVEPLQPWYVAPTKLVSTPEISNAKPVVIEIELPGIWETRFDVDVEDHTGLVTDYPIPPEYIKAVIPV